MLAGMSSRTKPPYLDLRPLPGTVIDIKVAVGDTVKKGQTIVILEAMKMENNIDSERDGKITAIKVNKGDSVMEGSVLVTIE